MKSGNFNMQVYLQYVLPVISRVIYIKRSRGDFLKWVKHYAVEMMPVWRERARVGFSILM